MKRFNLILHTTVLLLFFIFLSCNATFNRKSEKSLNKVQYNKKAVKPGQNNNEELNSETNNYETEDNNYLYDIQLLTTLSELQDILSDYGLYLEIISEYKIWDSLVYDQLSTTISNYMYKNGLVCYKAKGDLNNLDIKLSELYFCFIDEELYRIDGIMMLSEQEIKSVQNRYNEDYKEDYVEKESYNSRNSFLNIYSLDDKTLVLEWEKDFRISIISNTYYQKEKELFNSFNNLQKKVSAKWLYLKKP